MSAIPSLELFKVIHPKDDNCLICLDPLRNDEDVYTHAEDGENHQFHKNCWRYLSAFANHHFMSIKDRQFKVTCIFPGCRKFVNTFPLLSRFEKIQGIKLTETGSSLICVSLFYLFSKTFFPELMTQGNLFSNIPALFISALGMSTGMARYKMAFQMRDIRLIDGLIVSSAFAAIVGVGAFFSPRTFSSIGTVSALGIGAIGLAATLLQRREEKIDLKRVACAIATIGSSVGRGLLNVGQDVLLPNIGYAMLYFLQNNSESDKIAHINGFRLITLPILVSGVIQSAILGIDFARKFPNSILLSSANSTGYNVQGLNSTAPPNILDLGPDATEFAAPSEEE